MPDGRTRICLRMKSLISRTNAMKTVWKFNAWWKQKNEPVQNLTSEGYKGYFADLDLDLLGFHTWSPLHCQPKASREAHWKQMLRTRTGWIIHRMQKTICGKLDCIDFTVFFGCVAICWVWLPCLHTFHKFPEEDLSLGVQNGHLAIRLRYWADINLRCIVSKNAHDLSVNSSETDQFGKVPHLSVLEHWAQNCLSEMNCNDLWKRWRCLATSGWMSIDHVRLQCLLGQLAIIIESFCSILQSTGSSRNLHMLL